MHRIEHLRRLFDHATRAGWPALDASGTAHERELLAPAFRGLLGGLTDHTREHNVHGANTAGVKFDRSVEGIRVHVAPHGPHQRGEVNALRPHAGHAPAPVDYLTDLRSDQARTA